MVASNSTGDAPPSMMSSTDQLWAIYASLDALYNSTHSLPELGFTMTSDTNSWGIGVGVLVNVGVGVRAKLGVATTEGVIVVVGVWVTEGDGVGMGINVGVGEI